MLTFRKMSLCPFEMALTNGQNRSGVWICLTDTQGNKGWGECSPLPEWSQETLKECLEQLNSLKWEGREWEKETLFQNLAELELLPAVLFGLESALLSLLNPLPPYRVKVSALLSGSRPEILQQAKIRKQEGYASAKLKISQLNFEEAKEVIDALKDHFHLRVDVNRKWSTLESLNFFSQFPLDTFDYVEEPFQNPHDLAVFPHPLAIDESFPSDLSSSNEETRPLRAGSFKSEVGPSAKLGPYLQSQALRPGFSLENFALLPTLKALIYKPTLKGGITNCLPLINKGFSLVLNSSFESPLGLKSITAMAQRLALKEPVGIGTYHYISNLLFTQGLQKSQNPL